MQCIFSQCLHPLPPANTHLPTIVVDFRTQLSTPRQLNIFRQNRATTTRTPPAKGQRAKKGFARAWTPPRIFVHFFFANFYGLFNKTQRYISGSGVSRKTGRENKRKDCKGWKGLARVIGKVSLTCELSAKIGKCPRKLRGNCRDRRNINSNIPRKFAFM